MSRSRAACLLAQDHAVGSDLLRLGSGSRQGTCSGLLPSQHGQLSSVEFLKNSTLHKGAVLKIVTATKGPEYLQMALLFSAPEAAPSYSTSCCSARWHCVLRCLARWLALLLRFISTVPSWVCEKKPGVPSSVKIRKLKQGLCIFRVTSRPRSGFFRVLVCIEYTV